MVSAETEDVAYRAEAAGSASSSDAVGPGSGKNSCKTEISADVSLLCTSPSRAKSRIHKTKRLINGNEERFFRRIKIPPDVMVLYGKAEDS